MMMTFMSVIVDMIMVVTFMSVIMVVNMVMTFMLMRMRLSSVRMPFQRIFVLAHMLPASALIYG